MVAVELVGVVLDEAVLGDNIRVDGFVGEAALVGGEVVTTGSGIVDRVLGVEVVTVWEARLVAVGFAALGEVEAVEAYVAGDRAVVAGLKVLGSWSLVTTAVPRELEFTRETGDRARVLANWRWLGREANGLLVGVVLDELLATVGEKGVV